MTLSPQYDDRRLDTPPLQGRGRGWGVSANSIAGLHANARDMRRNPTEPETRLWSRLSRSQLGGFKFRRQATIGRVVVDFLCSATGLIVEVDGDTHVDAALGTLGYRVVRVANADVITNIEGVLEHLLAALSSSPLSVRGGAGGRASPRKPARAEAPHPNPSPEGEGLESVESEKLLGISTRATDNAVSGNGLSIKC